MEVITVIPYMRVSTSEQVPRFGLKAQASKIFEHARKQFGDGSSTELRFAGELIDAGVSGSIPFFGRPAGSKLSVLGKFEQYDGDRVVLLALCQDRLFRSVADMLLTLEVLREQLIDVVTVDEGLLSVTEDDDDRWMMLIMRAMMAEAELRRGRKRTRRGLEQVRARGGKIGEAPYGFVNIGDGRHAIHAEESAVVALILDLAARETSSRKIAEFLNDSARYTREGKEWTHVQVGRILQRADSLSDDGGSRTE